MKILKFGGTSIGSPETLSVALSVIEKAYKENTCRAVVISAFSRVTNALLELKQSAERGEDVSQTLSKLNARHIELCDHFLPTSTRSRTVAWIQNTFNELDDVIKSVQKLKECTPKVADRIASFGERLSTYIVASILQGRNVPASYVDARELIVTDSSFQCAHVDFPETTRRIQKSLASQKELPIITGFIAADQFGNTTTLGRGGSDYTAAILGAALPVSEIEIWTDVDGIMTADPRLVPTALPISSLSYEEALELSHFGAKVIYPPTIYPAFVASVPVRIRNTLKSEFPGSVIHQESSGTKYSVTGISSIDEVSLLRIQGLAGISGISSRVFGCLADKNINVILITQASSQHTICIALLPEETRAAVEALSQEFEYEMDKKTMDPIVVDQELSIISLVGDNMRNTPGIAARFFHAIGSNGVNTIAIAQGSSELNISIVINRKDRKKALNAAHDAFFLADRRTAHLFVIGDGLIGSTLVDQIAKHKEVLRSRYSLDLKLSGITNTKTMIIDDEGLPVQTIKSFSEGTSAASLDSFIEKITTLDLPHCVLVDCTASEIVPNYYSKVFDASVSIVTPNKRGLSGSLAQYDALKKVERKRGVRFFYETCVGAGLPVISTLHDLLKSGDSIIKIEAVLSGTLSFLFNFYDGSQSFAAAVREAQRLGYTEPDPRDDLSGTDVARKVLILAREIGLRYELSDIATQSLVPKSCITPKSVEDFYLALEKEDAFFKEKILSAAKLGQKLRYIGVVENGKVYTELLAVGPEHPFYGLSGSDNIVSFTTERYCTRPLVVKGPGAGPDVTAAGIFADIIRVIQ